MRFDGYPKLKRPRKLRLTVTTFHALDLLRVHGIYEESEDFVQFIEFDDSDTEEESEVEEEDWQCEYSDE